MITAEPKTAYPLTWPEGRPRTPQGSRKVAKFDSSFITSRDTAIREVRLLGGTETILSTNVPLNRDGLPRGDFKTPADNGVAVYFNRNKKPYAFACDCWTRTTDNLHAIALTIGALRGIARWGTGDMMEAAFTGFMALPAVGQSTGTNPWEVLGVSINASEEQILSAYRLLVKKHHPDAGGDVENFHRIQEAYNLLAQNLKK